ncbi:hypothetical protein [Enterococcus sp.]|uniref:hypothetical protein n=1 Tax=Enterococcus sp. TaxID=35783 RepID=UPI00290BDE70|nr:hypothetical protein [Enterococcus sp.]MDU5335997.1 hypothetical protein [Enterococcus sp.]
MEIVKLDFIQIFGRMTKENLMKRVRQYFEQTQNASKVVEALVAILLRNALCRKDYSIDLLTDLIHQIFLTAEPNNTLRKHCIYFEKFFTGKAADGKEEWTTVIDRLFTNEAEYREFTKESRRYKELLEKITSEEPGSSEFTFDIVSTFTDASGKKYKWILRDTKEISDDSPNKADEVAELLPIMTTLTIFQNAKGNRRFTEFFEYECPLRRSGVKRKAKKAQSESEESAQDPQIISTPEETHATPDSTINTGNMLQKETTTTANGTGKSTLSYEKYMDKAEAMYQLAQAAPQTELKGWSAAPNPAETEQPPTSKAATSQSKGKSKGQPQLDPKKKKRKKKNKMNKKGKKWK